MVLDKLGKASTTNSKGLNMQRFSQRMSQDSLNAKEFAKNKSFVDQIRQMSGQFRKEKNSLAISERQGDDQSDMSKSFLDSIIDSHSEAPAQA